jgi:GH24 family phage-related lysozyme (muramidase)
VSIIDKALAIIKEFEGFSADAYPDPRTGDEPWTIGYGTTWYSNTGDEPWTIGNGTTWYSNGVSVKKGDKITKFYANEQLFVKVTSLKNGLEQLIKVPLTDGQWACMISFAYNMGLAGAELQIARLNANKIPEFMVKHIEYINEGSSVEAGLRRRRIAELELFNEVTEVKPTWINLVRHEGPEYRAYLMDGGNCVEVKTFKTRDDLMKILNGATTVGNVAIGTEGWHVKPGPVVPPPNPLSVPYYSQRDYGGPLAWSICGCTSVAMVLSYWGVKIDPDGVLKGWGKESCQSPPGCEGVFEANKLKASHTYKGTWKEIRDQIDLGRPVVIHGRFTGSGHIIVIIGYDEKGYWCNDPAGKWAQVNGDSYADNPKSGAKVYYKEEAMWKACGKDGDVWYSVAWSK